MDHFLLSVELDVRKIKLIVGCFRVMSPTSELEKGWNRSKRFAGVRTDDIISLVVAEAEISFLWIRAALFLEPAHAKVGRLAFSAKTLLAYAQCLIVTQGWLIRWEWDSCHHVWVPNTHRLPSLHYGTAVMLSICNLAQAFGQFAPSVDPFNSVIALWRSSLRGEKGQFKHATQ